MQHIFAEKRNKLTYIDFHKAFSSYPAISVKEIEKVFPGFNPRNLGNWQSRGLLKKIRNGWYALADKPVSEPLLFAIANLIYQPSYISLESALSWHGLIPEGVFMVTSVSSRKTTVFAGETGRFSYQSLKPAQLTGFRLIELEGWRFKMAGPEKALLDFLHLHPMYNTVEDMASLRLNPFVVNELDREMLTLYADLFQNKALLNRLKMVLHVATQ